MRTTRAVWVLLVLCSLALFDIRPAASEIYRPWCAQYYSSTGNGATNCGFHSFAQCHAGIRGIGRGVLSAGEVFWPTRKEILVFDASTGARTRAPIDLSFVSDNGANLVSSNGYLVVAGHDRLIATGPAPPQPPQKSETPKVAEAR